MKKVLVVGHCNYDGPRLVALINENFNAEAAEAKTTDKAIAELEKEKYALVLVNRIGDKDKRNGLELIDWMQKNQKETKIMLITNFPDKMDEAVKHGAVRGFGKQKLEDPDTINLLEKYLEKK